jgi:hypothetical protein
VDGCGWVVYTLLHTHIHPHPPTPTLKIDSY